MAPTRIVCLTVVVACASALRGWSAQPPNSHLVPTVTVQQFHLAYALEPGSAPVESVQLWYTTDHGKAWHHYGQNTGSDTSMAFNATRQGLYGFYIVAVSDDGASSPPPDSATEPQYWVYVDYTPPVVQLHPIRQRLPPSIPPILHIRWSAIDNALLGRPIELSYRATLNGPWESLDGPLTNSGAFDWRVPDSVQGAVSIRIVVRDRGGHVVEATSGRFTIQRPDAPPVATRTAPRGVASPTLTAEDVARREARPARARRLFEQGKAHAARGEYRLAVSRLTDALSAEPGLTEALAELGRVLYAQGELDRSVEAYEIALEQQPGSREVLEGMALSFIGQHRFGDAVRPFSRIVQANPRDAEAWLNLGDIAIYQGDELLAREHYEKAMTVDPTATDVIEKTRLRLSDLKRLAREFNQIER